MPIRVQAGDFSIRDPLTRVIKDCQDAVPAVPVTQAIRRAIADVQVIAALRVSACRCTVYKGRYFYAVFVKNGGLTNRSLVM